MTDKNLIPVPESEDRRAARRAKIDRRRAVAERKAVQAENADRRDVAAVAQPLPAQGRAPNPGGVQPESIMLPPRAELTKEKSRFGTFVKMMFTLFVAVPTLVTVVFYAFVAADQYATQSSFAVRGASGSSSAVDLGGLFALGGGTSDTETADSFILQEYIESREMVDILVNEANFLEIYSRPSADAYYRLDPNTPAEGLVSYWQMMSDVDFDTETGIIHLIVRAFRPADAETITNKVLEKSEELINLLSLRSREDSLRAARREVELAEERFSTARKTVAAWRGTEFEIDPTQVALNQTTLVGTLEAELATKQSELTALRATMSDNSPRVVYVRNQIDALERQIDAERVSVAVAEPGQSQPVLTERLSRYEELLAEREFASQAYTSALAALESARVEALKQERYLAVFVAGAAPDTATYPRGLRWTLIVCGAFFLAWGLFALIAAAVRDRIV